MLRELFLGFLGTNRFKNSTICSTLVAFGIGVIVLLYLGAQSLFSLAFATSIIAVVEINRALNSNLNIKITVDKAVGVWISLVVAIYGVSQIDIEYANLLAIALSPFSFLFFIIKKPSTIGYIKERFKGGLGVVLSSLLAGFAGGFLVILLIKIYSIFSKAL